MKKFLLTFIAIITYHFQYMHASNQKPDAFIQIIKARKIYNLSYTKAEEVDPSLHARLTDLYKDLHMYHNRDYRHFSQCKQLHNYHNFKIECYKNPEFNQADTIYNLYGLLKTRKAAILHGILNVKPNDDACKPRITRLANDIKNSLALDSLSINFIEETPEI